MPDRIAPAGRSPQRHEFLVLFIAAAFFHFWGATVAWDSLNLPGGEFRQAQTAISTYYIQQENNFSLAYPTPVLGKPWSIPMEFPLYQWTVAAVSTVSGRSLTEIGRVISLSCFYLTLPAVFLLLGRLGLARSPRWVVLGLILTCPLYIYYSRAFLIETMALMFSAWFLLAFLFAVERRSWNWVLFANLMGLGAGLVKVTTFILFLLPASGWALLYLWRTRLHLIAATIWIVAATLGPFAATLWWIRFADSIKQLNPSAQFLRSSNLSDFNFGTVADRFSAETLLQHWQHLTQDVVWLPVLVFGLCLACTVSRRWWRQILWCVGCYIAILALFPTLYARHEYYIVANAIFLLAALGIALGGLLESRLPRWVTILILSGVYLAQMQFYLRGYYPGQSRHSPGGSGLTAALRQVTAPGEVLVVAGDDWSSITPFFAERRALMIRNGLQDQTAYLQLAFAALAGEKVGAVVLQGALRENNQLRDHLITAFGLDRRAVFTWREAVVFMPVENRIHAIRKLQQTTFNDVNLATDALLPAQGILSGEWWLLDDLSAVQRQPFSAMEPQPTGFYSSFGPQLAWRDGIPWFNAHPTTHLRFHLSAGSHRLRMRVAVAESAYRGNFTLSEPATDGVEIRLTARLGGVLYQRLLEPYSVITDRGELVIDIPFRLIGTTDVDLFFGPGAQGRDTRDWISLGRLIIE